MAALIMSVGFSVDIPAHICYHYYKTRTLHPSRPTAGLPEFESVSTDSPTGLPSASTKSVNRRLKNTLSAVGFPVVQAGVSTNLCVVGLLAVPMYMGEVFVACMLLCISLGLVHGLVVLPVLFHLHHRVSTLFCTAVAT